MSSRGRAVALVAVLVLSTVAMASGGAVAAPGSADPADTDTGGSDPGDRREEIRGAGGSDGGATHGTEAAGDVALDALENDWQAIYSQSPDEDANVSVVRVLARADAETLHFRVVHAGDVEEYAETVIHIDADRDASTGVSGAEESFIDGSGIGVDYSLYHSEAFGGQLDEYSENASGLGQASERYDVEYSQSDGGVVDIGVSRDDLGNPSAIDFVAEVGIERGPRDVLIVDEAPRNERRGPPYDGAMSYSLSNNRAIDETGPGPFDVTGGTVEPGGELTVNVTYQGEEAVDEAALAVDTPPVGENGWFAGTLRVVERQTAGTAGYSFGETVSFVVLDAKEGDFAEGSFVLEVPETAAPGEYTYSPAVTVDGEDAPGPESTITVTGEAVPPEVEITDVPATSLAVGEEADLGVDVSGDVDTVEAEFGNGQSREIATGEGSTTVPVAYDEPGTYTVEVTAEGPGGTTTETAVLPVREGNESSDGGDGDESDPEPPTASIEADASGAAPGEEVRFTAGGSTGEIDSFEWDFGDGVTTNGSDVGHIFAQAGSYTVELTTSGPGGSDTATLEVRVSEDVDFTVDPAEPTTADEVTFEAIGEADSFTWGFEESATGVATGETATHRFAEAGEYEVGLTAVGDGGTDTVSRTVEVSEAGIEITDAGEYYPNAPLVEGLYTEKRVSASVVTEGVGLEELYVGYDGQQFVAECTEPEGGENVMTVDHVCSVPVDVDRFGLDTGTNLLTITAVATDGTTVSTPHSMRVVPELLAPTNEPELSESEREVRAGQRYVFGPNLRINPANTPPINRLPIAVGAEFGFGFVTNMTWVYDLDSGYLGTETEISAGGNAFGKGVELGVEFDLQRGHVTDFVPSDPALTRVRAAGIADAPLPAVPVPKVRIGARQIGDVEVETAVSPRLVAEADEIRGITPRDGLVDAWLDGEASVGFEARGWSVTPALGLELHAASNLEPQAGGVNLGADVIGHRGALTGGIEISRGPSVTPPGADEDDEEDLLGIQIPVSELVANPSVESGTTREEPDWEFFDFDENRGEVFGLVGWAANEHDGVGTGEIDAPTAGGVERVTDWRGPDTGPDFAASENRGVAVWETLTDRAGDSGSAIAVSTTTRGDWGERSTLTPADRRAYVNPTVAADGDRALVAWEVVDADVREIEDLSELESALGVGYTYYDGESWSEPTIRTTPDTVDAVPAVAPVDDGFVLAWERADSLALDGRDADLRYLAVGPTGTTQSSGTIDRAQMPRAAEGTLAYYDSEGGSLVREALAYGDGSLDRTEAGRYDADRPDDVAVSPESIAWNSGDDTSEIRVASEGTVESLPSGAFGTAGQLGLLESRAGTVLTYRADRHDPGSNRIAYSLERDKGWSPGRTIAGSDDASLAGPVSESTAEGFSLVFTGRKTVDSVPDLFALDHEFRPDYDVTAEIRGEAAPGETATVEFTVHNVGDVASSAAVPVEFRSGEDTAGTATLGRVAPGETATGQVAVEVGESGRIEVVAGDDIPQHTRENNRTTVAASTPALSVIGTELLERSGETVTVAVTVANDGPVRASEVPVALRTGGEVIGETTVESVPAEGSTDFDVTVDRSTVMSEQGTEVVLDPEGSAPGVETSATVAWPLQPDLTVHGVTAYEETADGVAANALVSNAGTADASATLTVHGPGGELGSAEATVPAAAEGRVFEAVTVPLGDAVDTGDELTLVVESEIPDADPGSLAVAETVDPVVPMDPPTTEGESADPGDEQEPEDGGGDGEDGRSETDGGSADDDGAGFGVGGGLVGLLSAGYLFRRVGRQEKERENP